MINIRITDRIRVYNDGVLIVEGKSYNDVKSTVDKAIEIIQDSYQLSILKQIQKEVA